MTAVLERPVEVEQIAPEDDSIHTICSDCYPHGTIIPGTPVRTFCGLVEDFDEYSEGDSPNDCPMCEMTEWCPVCGCGCGGC
jgi:hypothetical protein